MHSLVCWILVISPHNYFSESKKTMSYGVETYYFAPVDHRELQRRNGDQNDFCRNCGLPFTEHVGGSCPEIPNCCAHCGMLDMDHVAGRCPVQPTDWC